MESKREKYGSQKRGRIFNSEKRKGGEAEASSEMC
jgi:hypothetical protein